MKNLFTLSLALVAASCVTSESMAAESAVASHIESGPTEGRLPPFKVTKVAGAESDGVAEGKSLCYRCRNSSRPQVVVFTRSDDPQVAEMVKKLDAAMAQHEGDQLRVFVNVLGESEENAAKAAKKFASTTGARSIPFVVPADVKNGPESYKLNPEAAVTVTFASDDSVVSSHGFESGADVCIDTVMGEVAKLLN